LVIPLIHKVEFDHWIPVKTGTVFLFFANPENLPRIMPPATGTKIIELKLVPPVDVDANQGKNLAGLGSEIVTSFRLFPFLPFRAQWTARITEFVWNSHFADLQVRGPFKRFYHRHVLVPEIRNAVEGTVVSDGIEYEVGYGFLGEWASGFISTQLGRTFEYRQKAVERLLS
jgi:ligand-binding SRPBCC domain-containing protein